MFVWQLELSFMYTWGIHPHVHANISIFYCIFYIYTPYIYIFVYSQGYQTSTVCPVCTVWPHFPIHCGHFRLCTLWVFWRQQPAKRGLQAVGCCSQRSFSFSPPGSSYLAFLALFYGVTIALPFYLLCFRKIVKTLSLSVENDETPADLPFLHLRPWILILCYKSFPRCHLKRLSTGNRMSFMKGDCCSYLCSDLSTQVVRCRPGRME